MRKPSNYDLTLTFQAPLLTQANGTLSFGVDSAMQKYRGLPILSGSLIRGNLRHALSNFAALLGEKELDKKINDWFGQESTEDMEPQRAAVSFDFFWKLTTPELVTKARRTRIKMDDNEKVEAGALQVIEDCFALGTTPVFNGKLSAMFKNDAEQTEFETWVCKALTHIPAMGSLKGSGFGKLTKFELQPIKTDSDEMPLTLNPDTLRFGIQLKLDRPLCIGKARTNDSNRIISRDFIPGNVLKAVVAENLNVDDLAAIDFDSISFSHAMPMPAISDKEGVKRPQTIPLSLAIHSVVNHKGKKRRIPVDVADLDDPVNKQYWQQPGKSDVYSLPDFQPDWKDKDWSIASKKGYDFPLPDRFTLIRTQIESGESNVAKEAGLFSIECCDTRYTRYDDTSGAETSHDLVWSAAIDVSASKESVVAKAKLLKGLERGLNRIGKTKAHASVSVTDTPYDYPQQAIPQCGESVVISLMTDARILPSLSHAEKPIHATGSQDALQDSYQRYWGDSFELKTFYAQQKQTGGEFFRRKFQKQRRDYRPEWLTLAGSVFVLTVKDEAGRALLATWQQHGIPAYPDFEDGLPHWKQSPHLPEHGFGQVMLRKQAKQEAH